MRTCKNCKDKFEPQYNSVQSVCSFECSIELTKKNSEKKRKKEWSKEKKKRKEALKTKSDYLKELQVIFNKWVRLRDRGNNCISCNKPAKKENGGHYRSVGGNPELRFEPLNCHLQCEYCNTYLHANLINYRINLIKKIGLDKVEWLESKHDPKHYTIEQIKELKIYYRKEIKSLVD
jgi:hypothetical protein